MLVTEPISARNLEHNALGGGVWCRVLYVKNPQNSESARVELHSSEGLLHLSGNETLSHLTAIFTQSSENASTGVSQKGPAVVRGNRSGVLRRQRQRGRGHGEALPEGGGARPAGGNRVKVKSEAAFLFNMFIF